MSDFLSGFNSDSYEQDSSTKNETPKKQQKSDTDKEITRRRNNKAPETHEIEIDPDYNRKKNQKKVLITIVIAIVGVLMIVVYYFVSTVKLPDFVGNDVSEIREWASEHKATLEIKQEYSKDAEINSVISQSDKAGSRIKKGKKLSVVVSSGADPEEHIELPDFSKMTSEEASSWVSENQAENVTITTEYSEDVEKGKFIKEKFENSDVTSDNYLRKNSLIVYYSKGVETFEKNISIEDFTGKTKAEMESWAKEKGIKLKFEEKASDSVDVGLVMKQSVASGEKMAKNDELTLDLSLGRGVEVPNFGYYSMEEARNMTDLQVKVKEQFSLDYSYGTVLYQSIEAGTELTDKDDKSVEVIYSVGSPYLKDYRSQVEGDLPKLFYEDYNSKGANIRYTTYEVDSAEPRGTVVAMSNYNVYVGLEYTVSIGISNGKNYDSSLGNTNNE